MVYSSYWDALQAQSVCFTGPYGPFDAEPAPLDEVASLPFQQGDECAHGPCVWAAGQTERVVRRLEVEAGDQKCVPDLRPCVDVISK